MISEKINSLSKIYAQAFYEATKDKDFELIKTQLSAVCNTISQSKNLKNILENPSIPNRNKISIIDEIFADKIDTGILNLLKLLIDKNRLTQLEKICSTYIEIQNDIIHKKTVEIISPIDIDKTNKQLILKSIEQKLNAQITPVWMVDESIIGGLIFKFDDYVIDTSIKTKLEKFEKNILR